MFRGGTKLGRDFRGSLLRLVRIFLARRWQQWRHGFFNFGVGVKVLCRFRSLEDPSWLDFDSLRAMAGLK
jgi:hypothetical protein